jgi:hypothetical protein
VSTFNARAARLLEATGVPLNTVIIDTIRIEPHEDAYLIRWDSAATLTPGQAVTLVAPD